MPDAVKIQAIDDALIARYTGAQIPVEGVPTAVEVFFELPSAEETPKRVYPSVTFALMSVLENTEMLESDSEDEDDLGLDDLVFPNERRMRTRALPYTLTYSLDTWNRQRAEESRNILQELLITRTPPKGYIPVLDIDGGTYQADALLNEGMRTMTEVDGDEVIYHNSATIQVKACLTSVEADDYRREKVAMKLQWDVFLVKTRTKNGELEWTGEKEKDLSIVFDGDTVEGV